jgi:beta-glucosidase/6-phospho-beta-glucosidase/beta-galactosidase
METEKTLEEMPPKISFGYATSTLQEDLVSSTYRFKQVADKLTVESIGDWATWFNVGFNRKLIKIWDKRENRTSAKFYKRLVKYLDKDFLEFLTQFKRGGVDIELPNNEENGYKKYYFPMDLVLIKELLDTIAVESVEENYANSFIKAIAEVINNAAKANIETIFFINQFSLKELHENYSIQTINELINEFKTRLFGTAGVVYQENISETITFELLSSKDIKWWKKYIDVMVEQSEHYNDFCQLDSIRISIEWSEIMPDEGEFNTDAAKKYASIIKYAKENGLNVIVCLNHMTMPLWIKNGWANKNVKSHFLEYVDKIMEYFNSKDVVDSITKVLLFNEPNTFLINSYVNGVWPPFIVPGGKIVRTMSFLFERFKLFRLHVIENWLESYEVSLTGAFKNTWSAHIEAYDLFKSKYPQLLISSSQIYPDFLTKRRFNPIYQTMIRQLSSASFLWINRLRSKSKKLKKSCMDFYGLQLYGSFQISKNTMPEGKVQGIIDNVQIKNKHINGWIDDPAVFVIRLIEHSIMIFDDAVRNKILDHKELPPISFTEFGNPTGGVNGVTKTKRIIRQIEAAKGLIPAKIDLMLRWALIDNWEWDSGYGNWARFGDLNYDFTKKPDDNYGGIRLILHDKRIVSRAKKLLKTLYKYRGILESELRKNDNIEAVESHKHVERYINNIKSYLKSKHEDGGD